MHERLRTGTETLENLHNLLSLVEFGMVIVSMMTSNSRIV